MTAAARPPVATEGLAKENVRAGTNLRADQASCDSRILPASVEPLLGGQTARDGERLRVPVDRQVVSASRRILDGKVRGRNDKTVASGHAQRRRGMGPRVSCL